MNDTTTHPAYCARQARKTPMFPFHNGMARCTGCGQALRLIRHGDGWTVTRADAVDVQARVERLFPAEGVERLAAILADGAA